MGLPWKIQPCYNKITKIKTQHTLKIQQEKVKQEINSVCTGADNAPFLYKNSR